MHEPSAGNVIEKFGFTALTQNWETDGNLIAFVNKSIEEAEDELRLDKVIGPLIDGGTELQMENAARAIEYRAASISLLRPECFRIFGQHAPLQMDDWEAIAAKRVELEERATRLLNALLGSTISTMSSRAMGYGFGTDQHKPFKRGNDWLDAELIETG